MATATQDAARSGGHTALTFRERMAGPFAMGATTPEEGASEGRSTGWELVLHALVTVDDTHAFTTPPRRPARLSGEVELPGVRHRVPFTDGVFQLFPGQRVAGNGGLDAADGDGGSPLMVYELTFHHRGSPYHLTGRKTASTRPAAIAPLWVWEDTTTLAVRLHRGTGPDGEVVGAGVLRLTPAQVARLLASVRTPWSGGLLDTGQALGSYALLFAQGLARTYLGRAAEPGGDTGPARGPGEGGAP
ncbi:hypothetical protein [Streptomyces sp. ODS28]|uniref:hypothetical protein n=1 Tax=Streptomyces sp. ODS28 TaxID=3136688 RepID=UPI0031EE8104